LKLRFGLRAENPRFFAGRQPPFLILANHSCVWDPFLVNALVPHGIHYVVTDASFRSSLVRLGLSLVGGIRKTKGMSDIDSMKNIMRVKERGGVIGIFPEGQNTWDGHSLPIVPSTAKLAKVLRIPVITARVAGAYFSRPRWARGPREGRIEIRFDQALSPGELKTLSPEEIHARISEHLDHDDTEFNRSAGIPFHGRARAEYLERALFVCPECRTIAALRSEGANLDCTACGYRVYFSLRGTFAAVNNALRFDSIRSWNLWQVREYADQLDEYLSNGRSEPFLIEDGVDVKIGYRSRPLKPFGSGKLQLHSESLVLLTEDGNSEMFPIRSIRGANVQNNEHWEFYSGPHLYRVSTRSPRGCTYKWDLAVRHIQDKKSQR